MIITVTRSQCCGLPDYSVQSFPSRLPDKVAADADGKLVFFGHTDVGTLNNVVELWR